MTVTVCDDVAVVIVTYQSAELIAACLDSIEHVHEVLVIDNASTDESADIAESRGERVVRNAHNIGFARAVDLGFACTTASYVLLLNPDARVEPETIQRLRNGFDQPDVAIVAARLMYEDGTPQRSDWPFPSAGAMWAESFATHRMRRRPSAPAPDQQIQSVVGACMMVKREAFEAVGGFDERFWLYSEETDFCKRCHDKGMRAVVIDNAVAHHVGGASASGSGDLARRHFIRGSERFVLHHHGRVSLVSYRLAVVLGSAMRWPLLHFRHVTDRSAMRSVAVRETTRSLVRNPLEVVTEPMRDVEQVVLLSLELWDDVWRRNQFLVRELVSDPLHPTRVLFVEPPLDALLELREGRIPTLRSCVPAPVAGLPGALSFRPLKLLPRVLGPVADRSLIRQVERAARSAGFTEPVAWINDSVYASLSQRTGWPSLYDITDDWTQESVPTREHRRRLDRERTLMSKAGAVVVCSAALLRDRRRQRPVTLIPNAVDSTHFTTPQPRPPDLPAGPTAVYVGTLHRERIDLSLLVLLATSLPTLRIVLVGPDALDADASNVLEGLPNVVRLGARPHAVIPAYLQHADVVIVPHVVSAFTESLDPIKLYECLAVGKPTVATPVAGFRDSPPPIITAVGPAFVAAVSSVLSAPPEVEARHDVPTWKRRSTEFRLALRNARLGQGRRFVVAFLGHTAKLSGAELALSRMLGGLGDVEAHVILGEDGPLVDAIRDTTDAIVHVLPINAADRELNRYRVGVRTPLPTLARSAQYSLRLAGLLRELGPDLIHANTLKSSLYGGVAGRLLRIPVIWHIRDRISEDYMPASLVRMVRFLLRRVPQGVIANSNATLATLHLPHDAGVVPNFVIHDALEAPHRELVAHDGFVVGMCGRLAPWKGQDVLLRAFAQAQLPLDSRVVIIGSALFGEDDYAAQLIRMAEDLGIGDRVTFMGFVEDVWSVLTGLDVLVHASTIPEPFGQVIVEGMAVGLPVIAPAQGGPLEIITDGVDGILVTPNDVAALAGALRDMSLEPERRATIGKAAMIRAGAFAPSLIGAQVTRAYASILGVDAR